MKKQGLCCRSLGVCSFWFVFCFGPHVFGGLFVAVFVVVGLSLGSVLGFVLWLVGVGSRTLRVLGVVKLLGGGSGPRCCLCVGGSSFR